MKQESVEAPRRRFCPSCDYDIAPETWLPSVTCPNCGERLKPWTLLMAPRLGGFLPVVIALGFSPALLIAIVVRTDAYQRIVQAEGPLVLLFLLAISLCALYAWSAVLLRRIREPRWELAAVSVTILMALANGIVLASLLAIVGLLA